jgi:hypothetical protein
MERTQKTCLKYLLIVASLFVAKLLVQWIQQFNPFISITAFYVFGDWEDPACLYDLIFRTSKLWLWMIRRIILLISTHGYGLPNNFSSGHYWPLDAFYKMSAEVTVRYCTRTALFRLVSKPLLTIRLMSFCHSLANISMNSYARLLIGCHCFNLPWSLLTLDW